jgi:hypothetical protein
MISGFFTVIGMSVLLPIWFALCGAGMIFGFEAGTALFKKLKERFIDE